MDASPISELELARLKARGRQSALGHIGAELRRPSDSWQQNLRWSALAVGDEWRRWQLALPELLRGDFLFTLALWVAVFSVAAAVVASQRPAPNSRRVRTIPRMARPPDLAG